MRVRRSHVAAIAITVFSFSLASSLRADVIGSDSLRGTPCPRGAFGGATHGGGICAPSVCEERGDCDNWVGERWERYSCVPDLGLCIERVTRREAVMRIAVGSCRTSADCAGAATCEIARRCVPRTRATP